MKIAEVKKAYSTQINSLSQRKRELTKLLKQNENEMPNFDRVELSKELAVIDTQYTEARKVMEHVMETEMLIQNAEVAKQQGEAMQKAAEDMVKIMIIMRRIMKGDIVPAQDEKKLMEFDPKLYMMAKSMASIAKNEEHKKHDSLWEEEEAPKDEMTPAEVAGNTEISVPSPDAVMASVAAEITE